MQYTPYKLNLCSSYNPKYFFVHYTWELVYSKSKRMFNNMISFFNTWILTCRSFIIQLPVLHICRINHSKMFSTQNRTRWLCFTPAVGQLVKRKTSIVCKGRKGKLESKVQCAKAWHDYRNNFVGLSRDFSKLRVICLICKTWSSWGPAQLNWERSLTLAPLAAQWEDHCRNGCPNWKKSFRKQN